MSNEIVVGFEGSTSSSDAVQWAADEARHRGSALRVVSCFDLPPVLGDVGLGAGDLYGAIRSNVETAAGRLRASLGQTHPDVALTVDVGQGPAGMRLLDGVDADDLVVVGPSSHDGVAAFWLGTTPRYLVHHSPCPVAVIRGSAPRGAPGRIVVGVDGSQASADAVRWAGDEADRYGVELVVVHAWQYAYSSDRTESVRARDLTRVDAACTLDEAVEAARERCGVDVTAELVEGGPVTALLETARDGDIVVVGSRGRGAVRSRLFGSTANNVLDAATTSVVVVCADHVDGDAARSHEDAVLVNH